MTEKIDKHHKNSTKQANSMYSITYKSTKTGRQLWLINLIFISLYTLMHLKERPSTKLSQGHTMHICTVMKDKFQSY